MLRFGFRLRGWGTADEIIQDAAIIALVSGIVAWGAADEMMEEAAMPLFALRHCGLGTADQLIQDAAMLHSVLMYSLVIGASG